MEIQKIKDLKPLTISKEEMDALAEEIVKKGLGYVKSSDKGNYWLITISPKGEIIKPKEDTIGHPDMASRIIYPEDKILDMVYMWYMGNGLGDSDQDRAWFMIVYGYLSIDGFINKNSVICKYNPAGLTLYTRALPDSLKSYSKMYSFKDENEADRQSMELADRIPYIRNKIYELLENYGLDENQIEKLLEIRNQTERELLDEIYQEYKKERGSKDLREL